MALTKGTISSTLTEQQKAEARANMGVAGTTFIQSFDLVADTELTITDLSSSDYDYYVLKSVDLQSTGNFDLRANVSDDNGATFDSGAGFYDNSPATISGDLFVSSLGNAAGFRHKIDIKIMNLGSSTFTTIETSGISASNSPPSILKSENVGLRVVAQQDNAIRVNLVGAGTMTGTFYLYGINEGQ